jgi:hypothetical protein
VSFRALQSASVYAPQHVFQTPRFALSWFAALDTHPRQNLGRRLLRIRLSIGFASQDAEGLRSAGSSPGRRASVIYLARRLFGAAGWRLCALAVDLLILLAARRGFEALERLERQP